MASVCCLEADTEVLNRGFADQSPFSKQVLNRSAVAPGPACPFSQQALHVCACSLPPAQLGLVKSPVDIWQLKLCFCSGQVKQWKKEEQRGAIGLTAQGAPAVSAFWRRGM